MRFNNKDPTIGKSDAELGNVRAEGDRCALRECKSKGSPKEGIILVERKRAMD